MNELSAKCDICSPRDAAERIHIFLPQNLIHDSREGKVRRSLLDHLLGTQYLLQQAGYPEPICTAGLIHSVYGTNRFTTISIDPSDDAERARVRASVGHEVCSRPFASCFILVCLHFC